MNNLDQIALKLNRAAKELRENLNGCRADAAQLAELVRDRIAEDDAVWLQGKLAGLDEIAALMRDDGFLLSDAPLEELAEKLRSGAFDRVGWKAVLAGAQDDLVNRLCDREAAVLQGLEQLAKLRKFLHGVLRSMLTGMDEGGIGF